MAKGKKKGKKEASASHLLSLESAELVFLRDLFSVVINGGVLNEGYCNVSDLFAVETGREEVGETTFSKVYDLCASAGIPVGSEAPDFIIDMTPKVLESRPETTIDED